MYATSDLACVIDRVERLGAELLLHAIGSPQTQPLRMMFEVCRLADWLRSPVEQVLRRAGVDRSSLRAFPIMLGTAREKALTLRLLALPTVVDTALAKALYLHVRAGGGPQRALRALPDPRYRRADAIESARARRPDHPRARTRAGPARDRRAGSDVAMLERPRPRYFPHMSPW